MWWRAPLDGWRAAAAVLFPLLAVSPALAVALQRQSPYRDNPGIITSASFTGGEGWDAIVQETEPRLKREYRKLVNRTAEDSVSFPDRVGGHKLVGQLCRTYLGWHLYTVGIYLETATPSWGRTYDQSNISELLLKSVGSFKARYKLTQRVNRRLFDRYAIQSIRPFVHDDDVDALLEEFRQAVIKGPTFFGGIVLELESTKSGLRYIVENKTVLAPIGNRNLSMALLGSFVEEGVEVPEFRTMLLENLEKGVDATIYMIWAGSYKDKVPAKVIVIIIIVALVAIGLLFFSCWFVWRRFKRPASAAPPASGVKRPGGAHARLAPNGPSRFADAAPSVRGAVGPRQAIVPRHA